MSTTLHYNISGDETRRTSWMPVITMATDLPHKIESKCQPVHQYLEIKWHPRRYPWKKHARNAINEATKQTWGEFDPPLPACSAREGSPLVDLPGSLDLRGFLPHQLGHRTRRQGCNRETQGDKSPQTEEAPKMKNITALNGWIKREVAILETRCGYGTHCLQSRLKKREKTQNLTPRFKVYKGSLKINFQRFEVNCMKYKRPGFSLSLFFQFFSVFNTIKVGEMYEARLKHGTWCGPMICISIMVIISFIAITVIFLWLLREKS